ncbi:MAG: MFS transporter [Actinomycetota bacterium]
MSNERTNFDAVPRNAPRLLVDRVFGPYFAVNTLASIGLWAHNVVAAVVAYQLTGSALMVGAVSIAQFTPQLLFAPLAGARADRGNRVLQVALARTTTAAGGLVLAVWIGLVGTEGLPGAWPVIGTAFVVGVGFAVGAPAMQAILPALVRPSELATAVALSQMPFTIARTVGPAVGALLLVTTGPALAFGIAAALNLAYAWVVTRLRLRAVDRTPRDDGSVRAGLRYLRTDPRALVLLLAVTATGFGVDPILTLTPPVADRLGGGESTVGLLVSAFGAGAALTAVVVGRVRRTFGTVRMGPAGMSLFAAGVVVLGVVQVTPVVVVGVLVAGVGLMLTITSLTTQLQERLPEHMRGRIMALWSVAFIGSRPLAAAINGTLADHVAIELAVLLSGALLLAGAMISRQPRGADQPGERREI